MSTTEMYLSITPLKLSGKPCFAVADSLCSYGGLKRSADIPSEDAIIKAGREILDEAPNWKQGKSYHRSLVETFHRKKGPKDGAAWYARLSKHSQEEITFEEFWRKLGQDKAENEMQCVAHENKNNWSSTSPNIPSIKICT